MTVDRRRNRSRFKTSTIPSASGKETCFFALQCRFSDVFFSFVSPDLQRSELAAAEKKAREEKERQALEATKQSLEKVQFDKLKSPFAKTQIRDAYLTYR